MWRRILTTPLIASYHHEMDKKSKALKAHKNNDLIQARYESMTLMEQMILLAAIGSADPRELTSEQGIEITASTLSDLLNTDRGSIYGELKQAGKRLKRRVLSIKNPDPNNPRLSERELSWVYQVDYFDDEGRLILYFHENMMPHLANLNENYTAFFVRHVAKFRSTYGIRLYELLVQWQSRGTREIEIDWLRESWRLENKYPRMADLKKWVIRPAIRDINTYSNLWVKMGQRKRGRRIVALQFTFGLRQPEQPNPPKLSKQYIEKHARPGETWEQAAARLKEK